ncbi:MAG: hypothetical protein AB4041_20280 [Microcystaceae cyanobacterium]
MIDKREFDEEISGDNTDSVRAGLADNTKSEVSTTFKCEARQEAGQYCSDNKNLGMGECGEMGKCGERGEKKSWRCLTTNLNRTVLSRKYEVGSQKQNGFDL